MTQFYTYLHCRPDGTPFYVGKGSGKRSHDLNKRNRHHKNIIAKYGKENILIFVFPCDSEPQAFSDEVHQIAKLRSAGYILCNATDGGEGSSGYKPSAETKLKISISHRGKKKPQTREQIEERTRRQTGKKLSLAHRKSLSLAHIGEKWTQERRNNLSKAIIGRKRKHSLETKIKIGLAQTGRKLTDEHKKNISKGMKSKHASNNNL